MSQVLSVAKELLKLSLSGDEKAPLTVLRLQKLLYYAQAWSSIVRESELFSDELQAWRHGPVVPAVHRTLADGEEVHSIRADALAIVPDLSAEEAEFVRRVWEAYGQYSALQLSTMTCAEMPWRKAWGDRPKDGCGDDAIALVDLEEFFGTQAMPASLAEYRHELRKREKEAERELAELPPLEIDQLTAGASSFTPAARRVLDRG